MKNAKIHDLLVGNCETDDDALYECEALDYQAKFLKICDGVKGCESIVEGHNGADSCEDFIIDI